MRSQSWLVLSVVAILVIGGFAEVSAQRPGVDTLVVTAAQTVNNDPAIGAGSSSLRVVANAYEPLVEFSYGGLQLQPALAEHWQVSADGRLYTFRLRRAVRFHDGSTLTAADVKFAFERTKSKGSSTAYIVEAYKETKIIDDFTIQIELTVPTATFLMMLPRLFIVGQRCAMSNESGGDMGTRYLQERSCGTGPYRIESWQRGQQLVLRKFDSYWRGWSGRHLERVVLRVVPEVATARLMLERGESDIANDVSLDDVRILTSRPNPRIRVESHAALSAYYLHIRTDRGPTRDPRVRTALALSFPYEAVIKGIMRGYAVPLQGPLTESVACFNSALPVPKQDLSRAKELLTQAGYERGLRITTVNPPHLRDRAQIALLWMAELRKLGVELDYTELELSAWYATIQDVEKGVDAVIWGTFPPYPDPDAYLWRAFHSSQVGTAGFNLSVYKNPQLDGLLEEGRRIADTSRRCRLYQQAQRILVEDYAAIWVTQQNLIELHQTNVRNFKPVPSAFRAYYFYPMYKDGN